MAGINFFVACSDICPVNSITIALLTMLFLRRI